MSIIAMVEKDTIKLPQDVHLEDGTRVEINVVSPPLPLPVPSGNSDFASIFDGLIGSINTGLGDLASNHEHYRLGTPKRYP